MQHIIVKYKINCKINDIGVLKRSTAARTSHIYLNNFGL